MAEMLIAGPLKITDGVFWEYMNVGVKTIGIFEDVNKLLVQKKSTVVI